MTIETKNANKTSYDFNIASLFVKSEEKNGNIYWYADNSDNLQKVTTRTSRGCGRITKRVGNEWKRISKKVAAEILAKYDITLEQFLAYENGELEIVEFSKENTPDAVAENDSTDNNIEINAVASYTLSAMCEEDATRAEEEIEQALELNELVKSLKSQKAKASKKTAKKMTEVERKQKWLENAKVSDSNEYYIVPELDYKGFETNGNFNPCFYIVTNDLKLTRIGLNFAVELAALGKAIEVSKAQVATFKKNAKKAA